MCYNQKTLQWIVIVIKASLHMMITCNMILSNPAKALKLSSEFSLESFLHKPIAV
jgi:hypothetical protein